VALRWTMSKDGKLRADMRLEVRVSKDVWDWMREHSTWSDARILAWWRDAIMGHGAGMVTVSVNPEGELEVVSTDDVDWDAVWDEHGGYAYCEHGLY